MEQLYDVVVSEDVSENISFSEFQGYDLNLVDKPPPPTVKIQQQEKFEEFSVALQPTPDPIKLPDDIDSPTFGPTVNALQQFQKAIDNRNLKKQDNTEVINFDEYFKVGKEKTEDECIQFNNTK